MAKIYGNYNAGQASTPPGIASPQQEAKTKTLVNVFDLSKQAVLTIADTPVVGKALKGWTFKGGAISCDVTMGTTTIAVGVASDVDKYKAAATQATPFVGTALAPTVFVGEPLAADEEILLTLAAASLPAAGKLVVTMDFLVP